MADTQANVVASERKVAIAEFEAQARVKAAAGDAEAKTINAKADAQVTTVNGEAEAGKIKAIGVAEADVIKLKIESMEADNYATVQVAKAFADGKVKLVPDIMAGGDGGNGLMNLFLAKMLTAPNGTISK